MPYQELVDPQKQFNKDIYYPNDTLDSNVKSKKEYGLQYAEAMYADYRNGTATYYFNYREQIYINRDYARGTQDPYQYNTRLGDDDEDMSFLNIDRRIIAVPSKFIDIAIGKLCAYDNKITANAIDKYSTQQKSQKYWNMYAQILLKDFLLEQQQKLNIKFINPESEDEPKTPEELDLWNAMGNFKMKEEIAIEMLIEYVQKQNRWHEIHKRVKRDLMVDGLAATKTYFLDNGKIKIRNCDSMNLILPYTKTPDWHNAKHIGEIVYWSLAQVRMVAGDSLTEDQYDSIAEQFKNSSYNYDSFTYGYFNFNQLNKPNLIGNPYNAFQVPIMEFEFKTVDSSTYQKKTDRGGNINYFPKDFNYKPEPDATFGTVGERVDLEYEMYYGGYWIVGTPYIFKYGKMSNIQRNPDNMFEAYSSFNVYAPDLVDGQLCARAERIIPFANAMQLSWLKLQAAKAEAAPKGLVIDVAGLQNVNVGPKGETVAPLQLIKYYKQKGIVLKNSTNLRGDPANQSNPIQELDGGLGQLATDYMNDINFNIQMMQAVLGFNSATDASTPSPEALVGVQNMAANATDNALFSIMDGYKSIKLGTAKSIADKVQILEKMGKGLSGYATAIGETPLKVLEITKQFSLAEFGIEIEDIPTEEQRQWLYAQIDKALDQRRVANSGGIELEDAIMIRNIDNLKLAERMLIVRRNRRMQKDQAMQMQGIQANGQTQQQSAQATSMLKQQEIALQNKGKLDAINAQGQWDFKNKELEMSAKSLHIAQTGNIKAGELAMQQHHEQVQSDKDNNMQAIENAEDRLHETQLEAARSQDNQEPEQQAP